MTYCRADTRLLIAAITWFSKKSFKMCSLLVGRFGQMANWTPKSHTLFSPFSRDISTLGGFVSNRSKMFLIYNAHGRAALDLGEWPRMGLRPPVSPSRILRLGEIPGTLEACNPLPSKGPPGPRTLPPSSPARLSPARHSNP